MKNLLKITARAILSPEKIFKKLADVTSKHESVSQKCVNAKFFVDADGSVVLNRDNIEVQKAFAANLAGLSSKKNG
ncbi:hypothetical protein [Pantoea stewartii]|uniref:hypothetical protein n=1 Tax=Pantoea stewartii TaxID=66269 RepID=UPI0016234068|nr:hypothetical protein [Pantoea stewartii]MBC0852642.1 hypothetical protein [Pantoea stewartii]